MESRQDLEARVKELEAQVADIKRFGRPVVRKRARFKLFGLPAYDIALGPDLEKGERMGHAKGFFAIGDMATGVFAIGGIAVGGGAAGYYAVGGGAVGQYVLSPKRRDPEAEAFFREYNLHLPHPVSRRVEEER